MTQCDSCWQHYQCCKEQDHKGNHVWKTDYGKELFSEVKFASVTRQDNSVRKIEWKDYSGMRKNCYYIINKPYHYQELGVRK
mgnify:CR=1 FL=1